MLKAPSSMFDKVLNTTLGRKFYFKRYIYLILLTIYPIPGPFS